jgi:tRNA (pseudouridine54-N1)-methyltransferase
MKEDGAIQMEDSSIPFFGRQARLYFCLVITRSRAGSHVAFAGRGKNGHACHRLFPGPTAMRVFVLRARSAPTNSHDFLDAVGKEAHTEILAHALTNAIFVAQSHRADVVVHLVLEKAPDYSRTISFIANDMHDIGGFHERAWLGKVARALDVATGMGKEETRPVEPGISVRTISFEKLVQELALDHQLFVMDRKGAPLRGRAIAGAPCFILSDHLPMPKNSLKGLGRLGADKISLGPRMLFASQCVLLIHNELDHAERESNEFQCN